MKARIPLAVSYIFYAIGEIVFVLTGYTNQKTNNLK